VLGSGEHECWEGEVSIGMDSGGVDCSMDCLTIWLWLEMQCGGGMLL
jgi:hypothetical protein